METPKNIATPLQIKRAIKPWYKCLLQAIRTITELKSYSGEIVLKSKHLEGFLFVETSGKLKFSVAFEFLRFQFFFSNFEVSYFSSTVCSSMLKLWRATRAARWPGGIAVCTNQGPLCLHHIVFPFGWVVRIMKLTREEEILLERYGKVSSTKSNKLIYGNALLVTLTPICEFHCYIF